MGELPIVRDLTLDCGPTMKTGKDAALLITELVAALDKIMTPKPKTVNPDDYEWVLISLDEIEAARAVLARARSKGGE
jgi:hypothetical protein